MARFAARPMGRYTGNAALARALARSLARAKTVLLSARGGRNADLSDRGGAEAVSQADRGRERGGKPRPLPPGVQDGDRRRQDDCHGDDHRLARRQQGSSRQRENVLGRLPDRRAGNHHPRPAPGPQSVGFRQRLSGLEPRADGPRRRRSQGPHRHHELSRFHVARRRAGLETRPPDSRRPGRGEDLHRNRRRHGRPGRQGFHDPQEHHRAQ